VLAPAHLFSIVVDARTHIFTYIILLCTSADNTKKHAFVLHRYYNNNIPKITRYMIHKRVPTSVHSMRWTSFASRLSVRPSQQPFHNSHLHSHLQQINVYRMITVFPIGYCDSYLLLTTNQCHLKFSKIHRVLLFFIVIVPIFYKGQHVYSF
jgi:hypothetical protein